MEENIQKKKSAWFRVFRILLRITAALAALIIVLILALNIPAVQSYIAGRFIKNLNQKTGTNASIGSLKIALPNTIRITDLYLNDQQADTLLYLQSLHVDISLFGLLRSEVNVKSLSLENLVANIHRKNTDKKFNFQFIIDAFSTGETPAETDTTSRTPAPWEIDVKSIRLKDIRASFVDDLSGIDTRISLNEFLATIKEFDPGKQILIMDSILLKNTFFALIQSPGAGGKPDTGKSVIAGDEPASEAINVFIDWTITAHHLAVENSRFRLDNTSSPALPVGMDYQHLHIDSLNAQISRINIDKTGYRMLFNHISLNEDCGINIKEFIAVAEFTDQQAKLERFQLITDASNISGDANLTYASFNDFMADLWNSEVKIDIGKSSINADEVLMFAPFLADNSLNRKIKDRNVTITAQAGGKINDLILGNLEVSALQQTSFKTNGRLTGLPDMTRFAYDVNLSRLSLVKNDLNLFVDPAYLAGIKLPESFELEGMAHGNLSEVNADLYLKSAYGEISATGFYRETGPGKQDTFNLDFEAQHVMTGLILSDSLAGPVSISGNAGGTEIVNGPLSGSLALDIKEAEYNHYTYNNIQINGRADGRMYSGTAISNDPNLEFNLTAGADLREEMQKYSATLNLPMLNLRALNFMEDSIALSTNLTADIKYSGLNNMNIAIAMTKTSLVKNEKTIPVGNIDVAVIAMGDSTRVGINSGPADGTITANLQPGEIEPMLRAAYHKYAGIEDTTLIQPGKNLAFSLDVHIPGEITRNLLSGLDTLNISRLEGIYYSDNNNLQANMQIPHAIYTGLQIDSLNLAISGKNENLQAELSLGQVSYDSILIRKLMIRENISQGKINSEFRIPDSLGNAAYLLANEIELKENFFSFRFLPGGLILDGTSWSVEEDNLLKIEGEQLTTNKFFFSNNLQSFGLTAEEVHRRILFKDFEMQNLVRIVEFSGKKILVKGLLNGEFVLPNAEDKTLMSANLNFTQLYIMDSLAGDLIVNFNTADERLNIDTRLESELNKIKLAGVVNNYTKSPEFDLNLLLRINDFRKFEKLSFGYLSDMSGKIDSDISLKGTRSKPEINGFIGFEETVFKITSLNFLARINEEKIQLDRAGVHFHDFVIEDNDTKQLTVNGDLLISDFSNPGFNLHLITKDFQPVNSTVSDNPLFYGKLNLDADVKLMGNLINPELKANVKINSSTDLTYALPGSELQLVTSEGVVEFIDHSRKTDSVSVMEVDYLADSIISKLTGLDLVLNLEIDPNAGFTVDIDPKSGDYLTVSGGAKLNITAAPNGKQAITGIYEVKNGVYQLSFYGLVKKTFTIAPGSTISWSGRPMDADLDITAEYEVRTSSVSLVANETAEMSDAEKQTFNKRLPYMVKLNIDGFLTEPEIGFNIDLPEKYMLTYPLVATKLALLNAEENEADLNKQVFALLVTGSFMADNPLSSNSSSPANIASTAARNSVNGILADQLNNVSGKYITGVDVNFGLTSYEDFEEGSGDIRTEMDIQVSKKLFNDRVTVEAMGSFDLEGDKNNSATSSSKKMTNEFAVIYQLTESGEYKLRAYYEDAYDLFDGDISYSGIALIFEREFDSLKKKKKVKSEK
ncbi:MAG: translocation/assembly module TamB domain-containing protein [Lentimicrobium sp.]